MKNSDSPKSNHNPEKESQAEKTQPLDSIEKKISHSDLKVQLELKKLEEEIEKIELEKNQLRIPWWIKQIPGYLTVLIAFFSVWIAYNNGYFDERKRELEKEKQIVKTGLDSLYNAGIAYYDSLTQMKAEYKALKEEYQLNSQTINNLESDLGQKIAEIEKSRSNRREVEGSVGKVKKYYEGQLDSLENQIITLLNEQTRLTKNLRNKQRETENLNEQLSISRDSTNFVLKELTIAYKSLQQQGLLEQEPIDKDKIPSSPVIGGKVNWGLAKTLMEKSK